jgi:hypothetical protein
MDSGIRDGTPGAVRGAFPSVGLGCRIVSYRYCPDIGEESPVCEDAGHYPPPWWGGWGSHCASGSSIFCRGSYERADLQVLEVGEIVLIA